MMPLDDKNLRQNLIQAYQTRPEISASEAWQQNVMREIRGIVPAGSISWSADFSVSVWRLAPAAGLLLILLLIGASWFGPSAETVIADMFLQDPVDFIFGDILMG